MTFERLLKNPYQALNDSDSWVKRAALANISRKPLLEDSHIFEELLNNCEQTHSFIAHKALKKLFPNTVAVKETWLGLFQASLDLLIKRACAGSSQLRIAALKALAAASEYLDLKQIELIFKSLNTVFSYDGIFSAPISSLVLIRKSQNFFLPEGFAALLASFTDGEEKNNIIRRELMSDEPSRQIPALISLQLSPASDFVDLLLMLVRHDDIRVAAEASRALLSCGGTRVYLVLLSLLQEADDMSRKAAILPIAAATDREEIWPLLKGYALGEDKTMAIVALKATDGYMAASKAEKLILYAETIKSKEPEISAISAVLAYKCGAARSVRIIKQMLASPSKKQRLTVASMLPQLPAELALPMIVSCIDLEKNGDVLRQLILALRDLLPKISQPKLFDDYIASWLERQLKSPEPFKRSQAAVLCGCCGSFTQDMMIKALNKEEHPHVIASLLAALGKSGCNSILIYSKYHDHDDSRVRANMVMAMACCGNVAIPYFTEGLEDNSARVRATSALNLFMLGQFDGIKVLNDMLQIPEPAVVLSACYALEKMLRVILPMNHSEHPLNLAISRMVMENQKNRPVGPGLFNYPEAIEVFEDLASAKGNHERLAAILTEKHRRMPASILVTRLLAAMYIVGGDSQQAWPLIETIIENNSSNLADMLDAYRTVIRLGLREKADELGEKTRNLYKMLLEGCIEMCKTIEGSDVTLLLKRLQFLMEPSMNLYNAMIKLKVMDKDNDTVMYLMTELILARPLNFPLIQKLIAVMPDTYASLRTALQKYVESV